MDRKTVLLITGGVAIALALFVSIAVDHPFPNFYDRPAVVGPEGGHHGPGEVKMYASEAVAAEEAAEPAEPEKPKSPYAEAIAAADEEAFPKTIALKTEEYPEHTKPIAQFTHAKHVVDYMIGCGDCHHNEDGEPLDDLQVGDPVERCIDCHSKPSEAPKGKDAPDLSPAEELEYHAEALHQNCKNCHMEYNKENNTRAAPTSCSKCHAK
jgi:hypothetical protein